MYCLWISKLDRLTNEIRIMYAGVNRFPGKSQGCPGTREEPNGDEQDPEAGECRNCSNEMNMRGEDICGKALASFQMCFV